MEEPQPTEDSGETEGAETSAAEGAYWKENLRLLISLMAVWFAQQGSIYIFIALIFFYVHRMKKIERKYDLDD